MRPRAHRKNTALQETIQLPTCLMIQPQEIILSFSCLNSNPKVCSQNTAMYKKYPSAHSVVSNMKSSHALA